MRPLNNSQRRTLLTLADGKWHRASLSTRDGRVATPSVMVLSQRGLAGPKGGMWPDSSLWRITDAGRALAAELREDGAAQIVQSPPAVNDASRWNDRTETAYRLCLDIIAAEKHVAGLREKLSTFLATPPRISRRRYRDEIAEARRARARAGVEALAVLKGAPSGWVDQVMEAYAL